MAGLVPAIHVLCTRQDVDARDERGHDDAGTETKALLNFVAVE